MTSYRVTTDTAEIKNWVESHEGTPAVIGEGSEEMVRIDFPGKEDERELSKAKRSREVSWDDFFKVFEDKELAFIYYPNKDVNDPTFSYRFIKRQNVEELEKNELKVDNFENPDAIETLPSDSVDERLRSAGDQFGFDPQQDNETLQHAPSPQIKSEQAVSGHMTDPASDDDTTQNAQDMGLVLEDDPQAQEKK